MLDNILDFLANYQTIYIYLTIFMVLFLCGLGVPIPEDITLFVSAMLAYEELIELKIVLPLCFAGVLIGDFLIFGLGSHYGKKIREKWFFRKILPQERLEFVEKELKQKGYKLIFAARFMPGLRTPIYFTAGVLHYPFKWMLLYDGLAALISVPAIIGVVYYFGDKVEYVISLVKKVEHGIFVIFISLVIMAAWRYYTKYKSGQPQ